MFCPICRAEYRQGFTHCTTCRVELVVLLQRHTSTPAEQDPAENIPGVELWKGDDLSFYGRLTSDLLSQDIPFHTRTEVDFKTLGAPPGLLPFGMRYGTRGVVVYVEEVNLEKAREVLASIPHNSSPDMVSSNAPDRGIAVSPSAPLRPLRDFQADQATIKVWEGEDEKLCRSLQDCLGENDVPHVVTSNDPNYSRIFVRPEEAALARQIIRQVEQATPPD